MLNEPQEMRTDPLWNFGSFGCTSCHSKNLMNPKKIDQLEGVRLAFARGGDSEVRLVHVTPPITVVCHGVFSEAKWLPEEMPLAYETAPVLIDNYGSSDTPKLISVFRDVNRQNCVSRFASKFRTRRKPLPPDIAKEIAWVYEKTRRSGATVSQCYTDSLPYAPLNIDRNREATYDALRSTSRVVSSESEGTFVVSKDCETCKPRTTKC